MRVKPGERPMSLRGGSAPASTYPPRPKTLGEALRAALDRQKSGTGEGGGGGYDAD